MKANPTTPSLLDVILKRRFGFIAPSIRRIIKLDEHLVPGQERLVESIRILIDIHREMILGRNALEPFKRRSHVGFVLVSAFRQDQGAKSVCFVLGRGRQGSQGQKPGRPCDRRDCLEEVRFHSEDVAASACRNQAACGSHCSVQRHSLPFACILKSIPEPSGLPSLPVMPLEIPPRPEPWPKFELIYGTFFCPN